MVKYRVKINEGNAYLLKLCKNNFLKLYTFKICIDEGGAYIMNRKNKIYLTENNCVII